VETVLRAIQELKEADINFEMYVMLGAWIECENAWSKDSTDHNRENIQANNAEIQRAVKLANSYSDIVKMLSVGNEAMVKWATQYYVQPGIILKWVNHLQELKKHGLLPKDIWITSSDNFASWGGGDSSYHTNELNRLYKSVDFISIHTYPMHDTHYHPHFWGVRVHEKELTAEEKADSLMRRALFYARQQYYSVRHYMKSIGINKPIHIGETGWATHDNGLYGNTGSRACDEYKSAKYYQFIREWTNQEKITCFYFEAFDEKWKDLRNAEGAENHFGLFTVDGKAKYALWDMVNRGVFNSLQRDGNTVVKTYQGKKENVLGELAWPVNELK
jgi:exo-beta-1,3-glucanase (GH17 family)